ncbi:hypothetical protein Q5692_00105, partial [Microcoleus sp. C2C3]|uniref:hypothetical protein n=1 Tax=Microcoleus sp. C2C3 TaxID=3055324 RepID=UPI002FCFA372
TILRTGKMPVPQRVNFLWGGHPARPLKAYLKGCKMSDLAHILHHSQNRQDACSTKSEFLVGWASCPPIKSLLKMVQDVSYI